MADQDFQRARAIEREVRALLADTGLIAFGWFNDPQAEDRPGLLIGNIGSSLWPAFSTSAEFANGAPDPMNRWSRRILDAVAGKIDAAAHYPLEKPFRPFQRYAAQATGMEHSPLGLLIHPQYGLWTALRGALVFADHFETPDSKVGWHPCPRCVEKPCLSACPVDAFSGENYDVTACRSHVKSAAGATCREGGCLARHACPVGQEYAYEDPQQGFHMAAFAN